MKPMLKGPDTLKGTLTEPTAMQSPRTVLWTTNEEDGNMLKHDQMLADDNYELHHKFELENPDGTLNLQKVKMLCLRYAEANYTAASLERELELVDGIIKEERRDAYKEGYDEGYNDGSEE